LLLLPTRGYKLESFKQTNKQNKQNKTTTTTTTTTTTFFLSNKTTPVDKKFKGFKLFIYKHLTYTPFCMHVCAAEAQATRHADLRSWLAYYLIYKPFLQGMERGGGGVVYTCSYRHACFVEIKIFFVHDSGYNASV
jgi:hypothetical protein